MTSQFDNLSKPGGLLTQEPPDADEFAGLKRSGLARLRDAGFENLSLAAAACLLDGLACDFHQALYVHPANSTDLAPAARAFAAARHASLL